MQVSSMQPVSIPPVSTPPVSMKLVLVQPVFVPDTDARPRRRAARRVPGPDAGARPGRAP